MKETAKEDLTTRQKRKLRSHFGFSRIPFAKGMWAAHMFDSQCQRELLDGLGLWSEVKGIALCAGPSGVGKSITLRRFVGELDQSRFHIVDFEHLPTTTTGFLRSLSRKLGLPMRLHGANLFDAAQKHLCTFEKENGPHPILVIDNGEGLSVAVLDLLRRLTSYELDAEDHFSLLLAGTEDLVAVLRDPSLAPLRSRIAYAHTLRAFALEDVRNYVHHHLQRVEVDPKLITEEAVKRLFNSYQGRPRAINQLATQALIRAAVLGRESIDGDFMSQLISSHPLYQPTQGPQP